VHASLCWRKPDESARHPPVYTGTKIELLTALAGIFKIFVVKKRKNVNKI